MEDLETLYHRLLPRLEQLEGQRQKMALRLRTLRIGALVLGGLIFIISSRWVGAFFGLLVGGSLGLLGYTLGYHRLVKRYTSTYKANVLRELVAALGPAFRYDPEGELTEQEIRHSGLFFPFTQCQSEDRIEGRVEGRPFHLAELNLWYEKSTRKTSGVTRGTAYSYIFKGLFLVGTLPRPTPVDIWFFSKTTRQMHPEERVQAGWQPVPIKYLAFRKEFITYSKDPEAAADLLPDAFLDAILTAREQLVLHEHEHLELALRDDSVYLSLATTEELFEPSLSASMTDYRRFESDFRFLVRLTRLVKNLSQPRLASE